MLHDLRCRAVNRLMQFQELEAMVIGPAKLRDSTPLEAPGFHGRFMRSGDLDGVAGQDGYDLDPCVVDEALARGDRCYGLFDDGDQLASYGWYSSRPTNVDEHFYVRFDPRFVYMYKGYTLPAYRGRHLYEVGIRQALESLSAEGRQGLVSCVMSNNFAALKATERLGYHIFGRVILVRAGELAAAIASDSCQAFGFDVQSRSTAVADTRSWLLDAVDELRGWLERAPRRSA